MAESLTIDNFMVRKFGSEITLLQQQLEQRYRGKTDEESLNAEYAEFDQLDAVELRDRTDRLQMTRTVDAVHRRRVVSAIAASASILIDPADLRRVLNDPRMKYQASLAAGGNRRHDYRVSRAFDATAVTGKGSSGTAAFDSTNYSIATGSAGMTVTKLRQAAQKLMTAENPKDGGANAWYCVMTAKQLMIDLLATTEVTSADFNTVKALTKGEVNEFMGFEFCRDENLPISSTTRSTFAWRKASMLLAVAAQGVASISIRNDLEDAVQIRYEVDSGATRMDEKGVVRILCTES